MTRRIEKEWLDYREKVLDRSGIRDPIQLQETRRAFYAGAGGCYVAMLSMLDPGEEATDADLSKMADLHAEFEEFAERIKKGTA